MNSKAIPGIPTSASISKLNCIDISSSDIENSVSLLKQACKDSGFFYVINHGISEEFMDEVFAQSKRFFTLSLEDKMKLLVNDKNRGYTPLLQEQLDPVDQKNGDYKEIYDIGVEIPEAHPDAEKPFNGPNLWPSEDILPGWRVTMERFHRELHDVARAIARITAGALDLDSKFFDQPEFLGNPTETLRLLHYPGHMSDPRNGIYGAGAHTDYGFITLLATDDVMGLQICKDKDAKPRVWEYVPPLKGAFIVNLGDSLERCSNGVFRSTLHRVLGNGPERYSIAFFVAPSYHYVLECFPTCKSTNNPPKFPPISAGDYILQRVKETYGTKDT